MAASSQRASAALSNRRIAPAPLDSLGGCTCASGVIVRLVDLRDVLAGAYGLAVLRSALAPRGFTGRASLLETEAGPLVAKMSADRNAADRCAALLEALTDEVGPGQVPKLLRNLAGEPTTAVDGQALTVLALVEGRTPADWPSWPSQVLARLGRLVAAVHAHTAALPPPPVQRDPFDTSLAEQMRVALATLAEAGIDAPRRGLSGIVLAHERELDEQLRRLEQLSQTARRRAADRLVLCHTDVAGDNIVVHEGTVCLLDWDEAAFAPAEADLVLAARDQRDPGQLRDFLTGYREACPELVVERDVLAFLLLRRALEDATVRVAVLADPSATEQRRQAAVEDFLTWGVAAWRRLDTTLALAAVSV
jgi:Ser/Thr protein kinase RdoA (MazF antagonist)